VRARALSFFPQGPPAPSFSRGRRRRSPLGDMHCIKMGRQRAWATDNSSARANF
jgi:hypothetical protein